MGGVTRAVVVATVAAAGLLAVEVAQAPDNPPAPQTIGPFHAHWTAAEWLVGRMDGSFHAQVATDVIIEHPDRWFHGDRHQAAYRASRPMFGWLTWLLSGGGTRDRLANTLLLLTAAGIALLTYAVAQLVNRWGGRPAWSAFCLFLPGSLLTILCPGLCEALGTGLALLGLVWWLYDGRRGPAVVLFCLAALTRETLLLVPAGLVVDELWQQRRWDETRALILPPLTYLAWCSVLLWRIGQIPSAGAQTSLPGVGLLQGVRLWGPLEVATATGLALAVVAAWRQGATRIRSIVAVHMAFSLLMGEVVWKVWWGFGRVLLPVFAHGLAAWIAQRRPADTADGTETDHDGHTGELLVSPTP